MINKVRPNPEIIAMEKPAFKMVSADSHVVEPPNLWVERVDQRYRERAPRIVSEPDSDYLVCEGGLTYKHPIGLTVCTEAPDNEVSMIGRFANVRKGAWDPQARLADMDRDGVEGEILYTSFGLSMFSIPDPDFQHACFRAFNDWLAEFCAGAPGRLFGVAMIPTDPIENATAEMARCKKLGLKAAMISISQDAGQGYDNSKYDPIWSASEDLDMPISLHVAASKKHFSSSGNVLADFSLAFTPTMYSLAAMIFSGVFDRHRKLKAVSVENDAAWVAGILERMDFRAHRDQGWAGAFNGITTGSAPSQIFHEHVGVTFMRDRTAVRNRDIIGLSSLMWGSDYPHFDGTWPHSQEVLAEHFGDVSLADQMRIARRNAIELYKLPLEA
jgi:predicted TIM-barrel fold metal-dependent hydrolase